MLLHAGQGPNTEQRHVHTRSSAHTTTRTRRHMRTRKHADARNRKIPTCTCVYVHVYVYVSLHIGIYRDISIHIAARHKTYLDMHPKVSNVANVKNVNRKSTQIRYSLLTLLSRLVESGFQVAGLSYDVSFNIWYQSFAKKSFITDMLVLHFGSSGTSLGMVLLGPLYQAFSSRVQKTSTRRARAPKRRGLSQAFPGAIGFVEGVNLRVVSNLSGFRALVWASEP